MGLKLEKMKEVEQQIRLLIKEYESRVIDCQVLIDALKDKRRRQRAGENVNITYETIKAERMKEDAKRQSYIQFISNLKEILGEM